MSQGQHQQKRLDEARWASDRAVGRAMDRWLDVSAELEVRRCELALELDDERIKELHILIDELETLANQRPTRKPSQN